MSNPLPSYLAKLGRAQAHLDFLRAMEASLRDGEAYRTFTERDPQTGEIVVYGEPRREAPTAEWGVVIGDIAHNLRSALDHLVWALTVANGNTPPPVVPSGKEGRKWRTIAFPVYVDPPIL